MLKEDAIIGEIASWFNVDNAKDVFVKAKQSGLIVQEKETSMWKLKTSS